MKKLYNIFESIILEGVSPDLISDAILNSKQVNITYDDDKGGNGKQRRTILPMLYGVSNKNGELTLRAFQSFGDTKTGNVEWKTFTVDKITSWRPTGAKFNYEAIQKDNDLPNYRVDGGDKDFSQVITAFIPNNNVIKKENL